ncbi:putative cyclin-B3-1 [Rhododendron vialii]|uniref:putative cyclin-B3-1 n=1 Tax=Rhododendron vialii TaxID=182163 RepID=UPI00265E230C|nr:putative cyclin-B3-1 [Rhododendron vialii]
MVAVKGKSSTFLSRVENYGMDKSVGAKSFKIYTENCRVKVRHCDSTNAQCNGTSSESLTAPGRKSCSSIKGIAQTNASDSMGPKTFEKSKSNHDISNEGNIGRKVLADVSNLQSNFPRTEVHGGPKLLVSTNLGARNPSASSILHIMGKARENQRQAVAGYPTLKRGTKDVKLHVDDPRSKGQVLGSINTDGRKTTRNPLPPTRNSLPASKWVKQADKSDKKKETDEKMGKGGGFHGFSVKPKVGRKVIPQVSNARSHLWRNRVSDGFVQMASKSQAKVDTQVFSRKPVKPNLTTTQTVPSTKLTMQSKCTSGRKESNSLAAMSFRREDEVVSSLSKNTELIAPRGQPAQTDVSSDCNSIVGTDVSDSNARKKSNRRKSFTLLLMARSKLIEEHMGLMKQESLPSIYDDGNHLEVAEYIDEIYQYYWISEAQNPSLGNYMAIQTEVTPHMRGILINWLIEVHLKYDLMQETLYLTITLLDRYLSLVPIKKNEMQLVGLTALLLASKYEDFWHPRVLDLISISAESYTRDQMLGMEKDILKKLKFRLNAPTLYVFMLKFLRAAQSDTKLEHLAFYLIELCLVKYEALKFKSSLLCASAIYVAQCTLQKTPAWTPLLSNHARYDESQMRDCAEMILEFHKAAKTAMLKVTVEKYARLDYGVVANIKPLSRLPPLT